MSFEISFYATILGAIILFLFSIRQLSEIFEQLFTLRAKEVLKKYTSNLFSAIIVGILTTLLLDSSSAVIILTMVFINAGTLDLKQGIGISLGANIGTTLQSQLFALEIMEYSFILLLIGFVHLFIATSKTQNYLKVIFYIGLLFFSLFLIEETVKRPEIYSEINAWLASNILSPVNAALAGGLFTAIIQSSGAMVGIVISLAKQDLIPISLGLAVMMGAELGTCGDILIASIGAKKEALYLSIFNILFNLIAITIGLVFFNQFLALVEYLFGNFDVSNQIANAHILFNVLGVIVFAGLVNPFVNLVKLKTN